MLHRKSLCFLFLTAFCWSLACSEKKKPPPPVFSGVEETASAENGVQLSWSPAISEKDTPDQFVYHVFVTQIAGSYDFNRPFGTSKPGASTFTVHPLKDPGPYFVVVRAEDTHGQQDDNTVERTGWVQGVRYVSEDGSGEGLVPEDPMGNIAAGIFALENHGPSYIRVSAGTYGGPFVLTKGISLQGGFGPDFSLQDPEQYETILQAGPDSDTDVIKLEDNATLANCTVTGAQGEGVGVNVWQASATVENNRIHGNSRNGIFLGSWSGTNHSLIQGNTIIENGFADCVRTKVEIEPGVFYNSLEINPCGGILFIGVGASYVSTNISGNLIAENLGHGLNLEIRASNNRFVVENNVFSENTLSGAFLRIEGPVSGGNTDSGDLHAEIFHNTFTHNHAHGLELWGIERGVNLAEVRHNWIAFNKEHGILLGAAGYVGTADMDGSTVFFTFPGIVVPDITNNIVLANKDGMHVDAAGRETDPEYFDPAWYGSAAVFANVSNNVVVGNQEHGFACATEQGGQCDPVIQNTIFWENGADLTETEAWFSIIQDQDPPLKDSNLCVNPEFENTPVAYDFASEDGSATTVVLADTTLFDAATHVEINGDQIAREIISKTDTVLTFDPGLDAATMTGTCVFGWAGDNMEISFQLDPESPAIDQGNDDEALNDQVPPGQGTERNDMGAYGGPWAEVDIP